MPICDIQSLIKTTAIPNAATPRLLVLPLAAGTIESVRVKLEGANTSSDVKFGFSANGVALFTTELTIASGANEIDAAGSTVTTNDQFGVLSIEAPFTSGALDGVTSIGLQVTYVTQTVNLTGNQTVAGIKTFSSSPIVPTPTTATQAANKSYVDGLTAGLSWKQAVRVATAAAGTLATDFDNGSTVDGVAIATGDRILIKNQAASTENGIYIVAASGAPTRATDADSGAELVNASVYASEGTANADKQFVCTTNAPITIGATNITFTEFSSGGGFTAASTTETLEGSLNTKGVTPLSLKAFWKWGSDIASASSIAVGEGGYFYVTGTTTITEITFTVDVEVGRIVWLQFSGALTLTHNSSTLMLPGGANITTAAGDVAAFANEGGGVVRCVSYMKANGQAVVGGGGGTTWTEVTGTSQSAAVNNGYITNNAGLVTVTLPTTAPVGSIVAVQGLGAGGWLIAQNASEQIIWNAGGVDGVNETTVGTGGSLASTDRYDAIELICLVADTTWGVRSAKGNITLV